MIERRPVHRGMGAGAIQAEEIRIPVKEERVSVTKEAVVKQVAVRKRKVRDTKTVSGDVRKEELVVEEKGGGKARQTTGGRH